MVGLETRTRRGDGWILTAVMVSVWLASSACPVFRETAQEPPWLIAHAGGVVESQTYTNSLEALVASVARGFGLIEIDLSWTEDGHLVLLHDWDREFSRLFDHHPGRLSLTEFRGARSRHGLSHLMLEDLGRWLDRNPDVCVITDIKERNLEGLRRIAEVLPRHLPRFLPQIYHPSEHEAVVGLGYDGIIFTLYRSDLDDDAVLAFSTSHRLLAVTMSLGRAANTDLMSRLHDAGVRVLVHTVNDLPTLAELTRLGAAGVYTDWLLPSEAAAVIHSARRAEATGRPGAR